MFRHGDIPIRTEHFDPEPIGMTYEVDGEPALVGLVTWHDGTCWVHAHINDDHYKRAFLLHRRAKAMVKILFDVGEPALFALCDDWVPNAESWLTKLGFTKTTVKVLDRNVWVCLP